MMLLRLSTLATGHTGIRPATAQLLADLLSHGITPVVREYGSLGCSGDLAPLAHCALAADGRGRGAGRPTGSLAPPPRRSPTPGSDAGRARRQGGPGAHQRHRRHARHAAARDRRPDRPAAASPTSPRRCRVEAQLGTDRGVRRGPAGAAPAPGPGRERGEPARDAGGLRRRRLAPRPGLQPGPGRLLAALRAPGARRGARHAGARASPSPSASSRARSTTRSCCPTPAGWSPTATSTVRRSRTCWTSSRSPSPIWPRCSERRTDRFLDKSRNHGLPPFLADDPGVDSGLHDRPVHAGRDRLRAQAPGRARLGGLDPDLAMQEDHVSMGWGAARKLRRAVDGLTRVLAIEVMTAARALDLRAPARPAPARARCTTPSRTGVARTRSGPLPVARDRARGAARGDGADRGGRRAAVGPAVANLCCRRDFAPKTGRKTQPSRPQPERDADGQPYDWRTPAPSAPRAAPP